MLQRWSVLRADPTHGKRPHDRTIEELLNLGFVVIDKPSGPSSHQVSAYTAEILGVSKAGHLGTLDPNVSGVLPVLLGRATPAAKYLQHGKEYVGIIRFDKEISKRQVEDAFSLFTGEIIQTPPPGAAVARRPRKRKVYSLKLLELQKREVLFHVRCEAGTYIRVLAIDVGKHIGNAAVLEELRRTKVGDWGEEKAITLQDISDAHWLWKEKGDETLLRKHVLPIEAAINLKKAYLSDSAVDAVCSGAQAMAPGIAAADEGIRIDDPVATLTLKEELVAFGEAAMTGEEMVTEKTGVAVKTQRVVMPRGTYPRAWKN